MKQNKELCSWCKKKDKHDSKSSCESENENDMISDFCNLCTFCDAVICCDCWDSEGVCFSPGDGYCTKCKTKIESCDLCIAYIISLVRGPDKPRCNLHLDNLR